MPETIYLGEIREDDFQRFRERDSALPVTYKEWQAAQSERFNGMRRRGINPVRYVIDFEDCAKSLQILGGLSLNEVNRDFYAKTQADARIAEARHRGI